MCFFLMANQVDEMFKAAIGCQVIVEGKARDGGPAAAVLLYYGTCTKYYYNVLGCDPSQPARKGCNEGVPPSGNASTTRACVFCVCVVLYCACPFRWLRRLTRSWGLSCALLCVCVCVCVCAACHTRAHNQVQRCQTVRCRIPGRRPWQARWLG